MGQRPLRIAALVVEAGGGLVDFLVQRIGAREVGTGKGTVEQRRRAVAIAARGGDLAQRAIDIGAPCGRIGPGRQPQRPFRIALRIGEAAQLGLDQREVVEDPHLQQAAVQRPGIGQRRPELLLGLLPAAQLAQRLAPIVVAGQRQERVFIIQFVRLLVIAQHPRVIARLPVKLADILQRQRLAALFAGRAEDAVGLQIGPQRTLQVVVERRRAAARAHQVAVQLGPGGMALDQRQRGFEQRLGLGGAMEADTGLHLQPQRGRATDRRLAPGQRGGALQRDVAAGERSLGIGHDRRLGLLHRAIERGARFGDRRRSDSVGGGRRRGRHRQQRGDPQHKEACDRHRTPPVPPAGEDLVGAAQKASITWPPAVKAGSCASVRRSSALPNRPSRPAPSSMSAP